MVTPPSSRRAVLAGAGALAGSLVAGGALTAATGDADARGIPEGWPMARYDPGGTCHAPAASGPRNAATVAWERRHDGGVAFGRPAPAVADGTVYVAADDLLALDADTGALAASIDRRLATTPAAVRARAYRTPTLSYPVPGGAVGLDPGGGVSLAGLDTGPERWRAVAGNAGSVPVAGFGGAPTAPPVAVEGSVVVNADGLVAVDASSGRVRWRRAPEPAIGRPAVRDGVVYALTGDGVVGVELATGDPTAGIPREDGYWTTVTAAPDRLLLADSETLAAVGYDGDTRWRVAFEADYDGIEGRYGPLATADGRLFAAVRTAGETALTAFDADTGERLWRSPVEPATRDATLAAPAVADGVVYATTEDGTLAAVEAATGEVAWRFAPGEGIGVLSPPAVAGGRVYVVGERRVYALEAS